MSAEAIPSTECFSLRVGGAGDEKLGELQAFGRYWVWGQASMPDTAPLRLYEWTEQGIADLTTEHYSLHRVKAGTPHHIDGLFGFWLISDADEQWVQVPRSDYHSYLLIAGGATDSNRVHHITWYCQDCGTQLGELRHLTHDGTPDSFLRAQDEAIQAFNADPAARTCPRCGVLHPAAYGFRVGRQEPRRAAVEPGGIPIARRKARSGEPVARLGDLRVDSPTVVEIDGREVVLVRTGDVVRALGNACPHKGGPLGLGEVRLGAIVCPWHRFRFDLSTGQSPTNPSLCAETFRVELQGDEIVVHASVPINA